MKRFWMFLLGGIAAAIWALLLVLIQLQKDLTLDVVFRPSWLWLIIVLAVVLVVLAILNLPSRRTRGSDAAPGASAAGAVPGGAVSGGAVSGGAVSGVPGADGGSAPTTESGASAADAASAPSGRLVATQPGVTVHGRLRANLVIGRPRRHDVVWKETGAAAGTLRAGTGALWEVVAAEGETLGHADSVTMGLAMLDLADLGWRVDPTPAADPAAVAGSASEAAGPAASLPVTIVDPERGALGRRPRLLGVEFLAPALGGEFGRQRYRTEAWQLTNGDTVVIVSDNAGTSLMNISEHIAAAIDARWAGSGRRPIIIEDWDPPTATGRRFVVSNREGGHVPVDFDELDRAGIVLPRE
ncbi:hypothetical protein AB3M89_11140 [Microbacterium sp. 179-I 3D2 NHS]|uniref:hypothetical protein n=1 Tax=Microbacterium sp. 179-I 3D2 NHS TaxID=3235178 RepID=UPI0039A142AC